MIPGRLCSLLAAVVLLGLAMETTARAASYSSRIADANSIAATLTNFGVIGNDFVSRSPSLEYPVGTGYEHMPVGGLWIGAMATDDAGSFVGVTTAMLDIFQGASTAAATEFTPATDPQLRSYDPNSPYFSPLAVSTRDIISSFDDLTAKTAQQNPEIHRPLHVGVRQSSYQWDYPDMRDFVIERFIITNLGASSLTNVHVGFYTEFASGPKNAYSTWPPTATGGGSLGGWYGKALLAWDAPERLLREHFCSALFSCHFEITPAWAGIELLTPPGAGQHVTLALWNYSPSDPARDSDGERYTILSAGTIADVTAPEYGPGIGDPVELLALGPFATIAPGDSVEVDFAIVGGGEDTDIIQHALTAQAVKDAGFNASTVTVDEGMASSGRLAVRPRSNPMTSAIASFVVELPREAAVTLDIVDVAGRRVARRTLTTGSPGRHDIEIAEMDRLPAGVYFAHLHSGADIASCRFVVLK